MSFTYVPGDALTSPNLAGGIEIPAVTIGSDPFRINGNGTFELHRLGGVLDGTPDVRDAVYELPSDDGGVTGLPFLSPRVITLEGLLTTPTLPDVWGAIDLLKSAFNIGWTWLQGLQLMTINTSGWSHKRQMYVQARPVQILEPDGLEKLVPDRLFTVMLVAPDPLMYNADSAHAVTILSTTTTLTNDGTAPSPFVVRFNGPLTDPELLGPGLTGQSISYTGTIASGHWIEVGTNPRGDGTGLYAIDDSLASVNLDTFTARQIPAGTSAWLKTGGSGTVTVTFRDAWY